MINGVQPRCKNVTELVKTISWPLSKRRSVYNMSEIVDVSNILCIVRGRVQFLIVITLSNSRHFLAFLLNIQILTTILKYTLFNSNNDAKKRWHVAVKFTLLSLAEGRSLICTTFLQINWCAQQNEHSCSGNSRIYTSSGVNFESLFKCINRKLHVHSEDHRVVDHKPIRECRGILGYK